MPGARSKAGRALLGQGRHIGDQRHAGVLGDAQQLQLAALHMGVGGQHAIHQHLGLAGHGVLYRLHAALVGHIDPFGARQPCQLHAGQVRRAAGGRDGKVQVLFLGQRHQLLQVVGLHRRVHHQHVRRVGQHRGATQVLARVKAELGVDRWRDRQRTQIAEQPGVAVGLGAGHQLGPQVAVGTGLVVDHHRLLELLRDQLANRAGNDVRAAAWRVGDHQPDRLAGPCIGRPQRRRQQAAGSQGQC